MDNQEFANILFVLIAIVWIVKIVAHFEYFRANDKQIEKLNLVSFFVSVDFFFSKILMILPVFFATKPGGEKAKRIAWISLAILWILLLFTWTYLFVTA